MNRVGRRTCLGAATVRSALGDLRAARAGARESRSAGSRPMCASPCRDIPDDAPTATALGVTTEQPAEPRPGHWPPGVNVYPLRTGQGRARRRWRVADLQPRQQDARPGDGRRRRAARRSKLSFSVLSPQISLNFGGRDGWSYISGGIGWAAVHDRARKTRPSPTPTGARGSINYGGGARWFAKEHLAFAFDLRFYKINAQDATPGRPAYGGRRMMVFSAGVSLK